MPLVAAAVCPHPPLLVPRLAAGAAAELDDLRAACREALTLLLGAAPEAIIVLGTGPVAAVFPPGSRGTLAPWGVDVPVVLGAAGATDGRAGGEAEPGVDKGAEPGVDSEAAIDAGAGPLPLSLCIGAWLLGVPARPVHGRVVPADLAPAACAELGRQLVGHPPGGRRVALLVMGDGSACRSEKAPGYLDERAEGFDADAARAFTAGDHAALAAIDPRVAAELHCSGRAPWQVLAGAAAAGGVPPHHRLHHDAAPYGVGYLVASWT